MAPRINDYGYPAPQYTNVVRDDGELRNLVDDLLFELKIMNDSRRSARFFLENQDKANLETEIKFQNLTWNNILKMSGNLGVDFGR